MNLSDGPAYRKRLYWLLALVVLVTMASRLFIGVLIHDQAELVVYSQTLQWTYDEQMPVLTWIMTALLNLTHYFILVPDIVKYLGVVAAVMAMFFTAHRMTGSNRAGFIAATAMFLIPTMNEDMLREYTHTAALIAFSTISFAMLVSPNRLGSWSSAFLLAGVWAGGILSKYTMLILMCAQAGAILIVYRPSSTTIRRLIAAMAGALAIAAPIYILMLLHPAPIQTGVSEFIAQEAGSRRLAGMIDLVTSVLAEGLFMLLALWAVSTRLKNRIQNDALPSPTITDQEKFLLISIGISIGIFAVIILIANVEVVRDRWLAPSLIMLAPVLASWLHRLWSDKANTIIAGFLAIWLAGFGLVRASEPFIDGWTGEFSVENYPLRRVADETIDRFAGHDVIVSNNAHFAATLKVRAPSLPVFAPLTLNRVPEDATSILIVSTHTRADEDVRLSPGWRCGAEQEYTAPMRYMEDTTFPYSFQVCSRTPPA